MQKLRTVATLDVRTRTKARTDAGRTLSRPWLCDAFIADAMHSCVHGKDSIVQKIHNSTVFSLWFKTAVEAAAGPNKSCTNLRAAKHRFESWSKPLGRLVMHLPAVFEVAHRIVSSRRGAEADAIRSWLQAVSAEELLQLSMCADGADEGMQMIRFCDQEGMDIAELNWQVGQFTSRIDALFQDNHCLTQGYTAHCKSILEGRCPRSCPWCCVALCCAVLCCYVIVMV